MGIREGERTGITAIIVSLVSGHQREWTQWDHSHHCLPCMLWLGNLKNLRALPSVSLPCLCLFFLSRCFLQGFGISMFLAPIFASIPPYATGPAIVFVGALMMEHCRHIEWGDIRQVGWRPFWLSDIAGSQIVFWRQFFCLIP